jgi:hypothetical protein
MPLVLSSRAAEEGKKESHMSKNYREDGQLCFDFNACSSERFAGDRHAHRRQYFSVVGADNALPAVAALCPTADPAIKDIYAREVTLALQARAAKLGW